ncbi:MAG: MOSC domain-containing protein [Streptosporangiales bacterium]
MAARVISLHTYPVKACRSVDLDSATFTPRGVRHDREFMVATPDGAHLSQREVPALATVRPTYADGMLRLAAPGRGEMAHETRTSGPRIDVTVHRKPAPAVDQGDDAARWLSDVLGRDCRLVRCPDDGGKRVNPAYGDGHTMYADAYPATIVSAESLDGLNERLAEPVPMDRFRQNVVVAGWGEPHGEDDVRLLRIGEVMLRLVKPDDRCVVTTIDQATGERTREPLRTLARYRTRDQKICFGMFAMVEQPGVVRLDDEAEILESRPVI